MLSIDIVTDLTQITQSHVGVPAVSTISGVYKDFIHSACRLPTFPPLNFGYFNTRGTPLRNQLPGLMPNLPERLAHIEVFSAEIATGPVDNITVALTPGRFDS